MKIKAVIKTVAASAKWVLELTAAGIVVCEHVVLLCSTHHFAADPVSLSGIAIVAAHHLLGWLAQSD